MSEVISLGTARGGVRPRMRIGLLRLTDGAPVLAAHEFGFFADEGLDTEIHVEPSWANIADKLAYGFLDAAVIVPPLAFNVHLGLRGAAERLVIPYGVSTGGNSVTLARPLGETVLRRARSEDVPILQALASCVSGGGLTLGVVHAYSTHNLLLRYWLATAGIEAPRDVRLTVVAPARAVEALTSGEIAGFCAGAPWGEVARRAGAGVTVAATNDIWRNAPEKSLAVRARWMDENLGALDGALRALLRASRFCDAPENAEYAAALLSRRRYVSIDPHAILAGLPGGAAPNRGCSFHRGAATFPWRSQGLWFLNEMRRWGLLDPGIGLEALAGDVYRPDLYRAALKDTGESVPVADSKTEGGHGAPWNVAGSTGPIDMPGDAFCDGAVFDPAAVAPPSPAAARQGIQ